MLPNQSALPSDGGSSHSVPGATHKSMVMGVNSILSDPSRGNVEAESLQKPMEKRYKPAGTASRTSTSHSSAAPQASQRKSLLPNAQVDPAQARNNDARRLSYPPAVHRRRRGSRDGAKVVVPSGSTAKPRTHSGELTNLPTNTCGASNNTKADVLHVNQQNVHPAPRSDLTSSSTGIQSSARKTSTVHSGGQSDEQVFSAAASEDGTEPTVDEDDTYDFLWKDSGYRPGSKKSSKQHKSTIKILRGLLPAMVLSGYQNSVEDPWPEEDSIPMDRLIRQKWTDVALSQGHGAMPKYTEVIPRPDEARYVSCDASRKQI